MRAARDALGERPPTAAEGRAATDDSPTVPSGAPLASPATAEELVSPGPGRRRRAIALIAIVAAVTAAAVVLGIVLTRGGSDPGGTTEATPAAGASAPGTTASRSILRPRPMSRRPRWSSPAVDAGRRVRDRAGGRGVARRPVGRRGRDRGAGGDGRVRARCWCGRADLPGRPTDQGECPPRGMRWKLEHAERGIEVFDEPLFDCGSRSTRMASRWRRARTC